MRVFTSWAAASCFQEVGGLETCAAALPTTPVFRLGRAAIAAVDRPEMVSILLWPALKAGQCHVRPVQGRPYTESARRALLWRQQD